MNDYDKFMNEYNLIYEETIKRLQRNNQRYKRLSFWLIILLIFSSLMFYFTINYIKRKS